MSPLLRVQNLTISFRDRAARLVLVDDVSFELRQGEILGVAGESGSGKTMTALAVMGLLPRGVSAEGRILFNEENVLSGTARTLQRLRGTEIAIAFQEPLSALHPMLTIERQLTEHVRFHTGTALASAHRRAIALLDEVRIPDPEKALGGYPHQFSGGMRQRIQIAMALACEPRLLIADEPTTALDVTVQAGILHLLDALRRQRGLAILLITHDLGVLSALADNVSVMYAGRVVESGRMCEVIAHPRHPYTHGLLAALPRLNAPSRELLTPIPGVAPDAGHRPAGCAFHLRCGFREAACIVHVPPRVSIGRGRTVACAVDPLAPIDAESLP